MRKWFASMGLVLAMLTGLLAVNPADPAGASNGNLSSVDNCGIGVLYYQANGGLPGQWALYDAYYKVYPDGHGVEYACQAFSFTYGFATFVIFDNDVYLGGDGAWVPAYLGFRGTSRAFFPGFTAQMCHGTRYVSHPGMQCWEVE